MSTNLYPVNEIVASLIMPALTDEQVKSFNEHPSNFMKSQLDVDISGDISVVENTSDTIHLALPYYGFVAELSSVELSPEQLAEVTGGEILILLCFGIGALGTAVATSATVLGGTGVIVASCIGGAVGGAVGAAALGTAIAAGARNKHGKKIDGSKK